jgi:hypothetical protein
MIYHHRLFVDRAVMVAFLKAIHARLYIAVRNGAQLQAALRPRNYKKRGRVSHGPLPFQRKGLISKQPEYGEGNRLSCGM